MMNKSATIKASATPKAVANLSDAYQEERYLNPEALEGSLLDRMPSPTGWRLLILPYRGKGKTEGGIHLPDQVREQNQVSTQVGYVLKMGTLCYQDKEKFPFGAWLKYKIQTIFCIFRRYKWQKTNK
jgi:hypothetical protein